MKIETKYNLDNEVYIIYKKIIEVPIEQSYSGHCIIRGGKLYKTESIDAVSEKMVITGVSFSCDKDYGEQVQYEIANLYHKFEQEIFSTKEEALNYIKNESTAE